MEQFNDFESLVTAIEPLALRGGVCKIIPPRKWRDELERRNGSEKTRVFDEEQFPIMKPIVQHFNGSSGIFHQYNVEFHRKLKLAQFFQMSQDSSHKRPEVKVATASDDRKSETEEKNAGTAWADHTGAQQQKRYTADDGRALFVTAREYAENEELERIYWKNMLFQPPMYGADVLGTLFPPYDEFPAWNIRNLPGLLRQIGQRMPGVNDPYLYLGMWKATFAWHVEDMDLYSINYIHFGEPKSWYSIPIDARSRFEMSMQNVFANDYKSCAQFLRHKSFLLSPRFLASQGIPFNRVVQRAGEIILTFPLGYHAGFNHGFNCAESVNFALDRWLDIAWNSKHCECVKDSVTIDLMEWFGDARKE
ncbi:the Rph1 catalytic core with A-Ketoglutarate, partial [Coemansia mojavensis]